MAKECHLAAYAFDTMHAIVVETAQGSGAIPTVVSGQIQGLLVSNGHQRNIFYFSSYHLHHREQNNLVMRR